jgi:hypothetical protein
MVSIRSAATALTILAIAPGVFASSPAAAPLFATTIAGVVRDDVGSTLPGVEVLILAPEGNSGGVLLRGLSDASGRFVVKQTDYGITPISVGGVVKVKDQLDITFEVVAGE